MNEWKERFAAPAIQRTAPRLHPRGFLPDRNLPRESSTPADLGYLGICQGASQGHRSAPAPAVSLSLFYTLIVIFHFIRFCLAGKTALFPGLWYYKSTSDGAGDRPRPMPFGPIHPRGLRPRQQGGSDHADRPLQPTLTGRSPQAVVRDSRARNGQRSWAVSGRPYLPQGALPCGRRRSPPMINPYAHPSSRGPGPFPSESAPVRARVPKRDRPAAS